MNDPRSSPFWAPRTLDWYRSAAAHSGYHEKLAALLAPELEDCASVCDLGCGPGLLSLALLDRVPELTALDLDGAALERLRQQAEGRSGLHIRRADAMALGPEDRWDCLILSFFGRITVDDHFDYFMSHCDRKLICVVNTALTSSFSSTGRSTRKREHAGLLSRFLTDRDVSFTRRDLVLEFGQPLEDLEDARQFIACHSPPDSPLPGEAELRSRLDRLPDGRWYLPHPKGVSIFVIGKEALPHVSRSE